MNTYTHVSQSDLAADLESLDQLTISTAQPAPNEPALPTDLTNLLGNWASLPEHVRTAISTLAVNRCYSFSPYLSVKADRDRAMKSS